MECNSKLTWVVVLPACRAHVSIHAEQRAPAEQQVVNCGELAVKPDVDVDDWHALQAVELLEEGSGGPGLWTQQLHDVHGHGTDVQVTLDL